ncbi:hypothetical protein GJ496_005671 [Pomphorhynchus laevis]|nr:hypothetical protein GJ496_005671 [Pomphorhynchus laevis]
MPLMSSELKIGRHFDVVSYFKSNIDKLTPVGLAFMQCKWDLSVSNVFHDYFECQEPIYDYDFDDPNLPEQEDVVPGTPFNVCVDY